MPSVLQKSSLAKICLLGIFLLGLFLTPLSYSLETLSDQDRLVDQTASENQNNLSFKNSDFQEKLQLFLLTTAISENIPFDILQPSFSNMKPNVKVKKYIAPDPHGKVLPKNWTSYLANVMSSKRLIAGEKFWRTHQNFLEKTQLETGVPVEIIVSILGIETIYGSYMGDFSVRDSLTTLAFDYPPASNKTSRETLFKNQLKDLIVYCWNKNNANSSSFGLCLNQLGSFAGAIGMPQFMPSSILKFAKDGDGDGKIDLRNNPQDAILSVANFLVAHGWKKDEPIELSINNQQQSLKITQQLADGDPAPKLSLGQLKNERIIDEWPSPLNSDTPALIVDLPRIDPKGEIQTSYLVGLKNFEVITQYNRSFFYAQAVTEFGSALAQSVKNNLHQTTKKEAVKQGKRQLKDSGHHGHTQ
jgi:membrane-bound lytic murein transglycosylase B